MKKVSDFNFCLLLICSILVFTTCNSKNILSVKIDNNKETVAKNAMVSTAHPLASKIGLSILQNGGNAIDAAIAIQYALAVAYPRAGNLGGGGFMIYRNSEGYSTTLDFREKAPKKANRNMYLDEKKNVIADLSTYGALAVGVPGTVKGIFEMHEKYGSMPMEKLIDPAIILAEKGIELMPNETKLLNEKRNDFLKHNPNNTYFTKDKLFETGDILIQKDLAETLKRIKKNGVKEFYEGKTADLIVEEMESSGGIISSQDLKDYKTIWRKPIEGTYKNYNIVSMAPPSSGGILLVQMLKMLENFNLKNYKNNSVAYIHLLAEIERRAYADRAEHFGDPDFWKVPATELLNEKMLDERAKQINLKKASNSNKIKAAVFNQSESEETTHFSIVDKFGNAVSITTTLNGNFGSKLFVNGAGFLLNNEMDDFSSKPGSPNLYGLIGGEANAIAPEKRMLSSMTPTIVEKDNELFMVLGSPGGSTIITSVLQTFLNVVEFNFNIEKAVNNFRFHHQCLPDQIYYESKDFDSNVIPQLQKMNHKTKLRKPIGKVDAIVVLPDGNLQGASDFRGEGAALGF